MTARLPLPPYMPPFWRWRAMRIGAVALAAVATWEAYGAWRAFFGYKFELVTVLPDRSVADDAEFRLDGMALHRRLIVRHAETGLRIGLYEPLRLPARPAELFVSGRSGGRDPAGDLPQRIDVDFPPGISSCVVLVDLRGPIARAGRCSGATAYDRH